MTDKDRRNNANSQDGRRTEEVNTGESIKKESKEENQEPKPHEDEDHGEIEHDHEEIEHEGVNILVAIVIAILAILGLLSIVYALKKAHEVVHHEHH